MRKNAFNEVRKLVEKKSHGREGGTCEKDLTEQMGKLELTNKKKRKGMRRRGETKEATKRWGETINLHKLQLSPYKGIKKRLQLKFPGLIIETNFKLNSLISLWTFANQLNGSLNFLSLQSVLFSHSTPSSVRISPFSFQMPGFDGTSICLMHTIQPPHMKRIESIRDSSSNEKLYHSIPWTIDFFIHLSFPRHAGKGRAQNTRWVYKNSRPDANAAEDENVYRTFMFHSS